MLCPQSETEEFEFYLKFCRPLVINLSTSSDRFIATAWVKKLRETYSNPGIKLEYLKLLIFLLLKRQLLGPFRQVPNGEAISSLPYPLPVQYCLKNMAKNFIDMQQQAKMKELRYGNGDCPSYITYSSDFLECCSIQNIPNFGIQGYFATSRDPISNWINIDKTIHLKGMSFPESTPINEQDRNISCFIDPDHFLKGQSPKTEDKQASEISKSGSEKPKRHLPVNHKEKESSIEDLSEKERSPDRKRKLPFEYYKMKEKESFDRKQIKQKCDIHEDRIPPSWGSNLINVTDSPKPAKSKKGDSGLDELFDILTDQDESEGWQTVEKDVVTSQSSESSVRNTKTPKSSGKSKYSPIQNIFSSTKYCKLDKRGQLQNTLFGSDFLGDLSEISLSDDDFKTMPVNIPSPRRGKKPPGSSDVYPPCSFLTEEERMQMGTPQRRQKTPVRPTSPCFNKRSPAAPATRETPSKYRNTARLTPTPRRSPQDTMSPIPFVPSPGFDTDEDRNFRWVQKRQRARPFPKEETIDPKFWESYSWWDEDPDVMFQFQPPSPVGDREIRRHQQQFSLGQTPPIFKKGSGMRQMILEDYQYDPAEFGIDQDDWVGAEQFFNKEPVHGCNYVDPRDLNRRTPTRPRSPVMQSCNESFTEILKQPGRDSFDEFTKTKKNDVFYIYSPMGFHESFSEEAIESTESESPVRMYERTSPDFGCMQNKLWQGMLEDKLFEGDNLLNESMPAAEFADSDLDYESPVAKGKELSKRKSPARKSSGKKLSGKKSSERTLPEKKSSARKSPGRKSPDRKSPVKKLSEKKLSERKSPERKSPERKTSGRKSPERKTSERKSPIYGTEDRRKSISPIKKTQKFIPPSSPKTPARQVTSSIQEPSFSQDDMILQNIETKTPQGAIPPVWQYQTPPQYKTQKEKTPQKQRSPQTSTILPYSPGRDFFQVAQNSNNMFDDSPPMDFPSSPSLIISPGSPSNLISTQSLRPRSPISPRSSAKSPETGLNLSPWGRPMGRDIFSSPGDDNVNFLSDEKPPEFVETDSPKGNDVLNSTASLSCSSKLRHPAKINLLSNHEVPRHQRDPFALAFRQELELKEMQPYTSKDVTDLQCGKRRIKVRKELTKPKLITISESDLEYNPPRAEDLMKQIPQGKSSPISPKMEQHRRTPVRTPKRGIPAVYPNRPTSPCEEVIDPQDIARFDFKRYEYVPTKPQAPEEDILKSPCIKGKKKIPRRLLYESEEQDILQKPSPTKIAQNTSLHKTPSPPQRIQKRVNPISIPTLSPDIDIFKKPNNRYIDLLTEEIPSDFEYILESPIQSPQERAAAFEGLFDENYIDDVNVSLVQSPTEMYPPSPDDDVWDMYNAVKRHERKPVQRQTMPVRRIPRLEEIAEHPDEQYPFWDHRRLPRQPQEPLTAETRKHIDKTLKEETSWLQRQRDREAEERKKMFQAETEWLRAQERKKLDQEKKAQKLAEKMRQEEQAARRAKLSPKLLARIQKARAVQPIKIDSPIITEESKPLQSSCASTPAWNYQSPPMAKCQKQPIQQQESIHQEEQQEHNTTVIYSPAPESDFFVLPEVSPYANNNICAFSPPEDMQPGSPDMISPQKCCNPRTQQKIGAVSPKISDDQRRAEEQWVMYVSNEGGLLEAEMEPELVYSPPPVQMDPLDKAWKQEVDLKNMKKFRDKQYWDLQVGRKAYKAKIKPSRQPQLQTITETEKDLDIPPARIIQRPVVIAKGSLMPTVYSNTSGSPDYIRIQYDIPELASPVRSEFKSKMNRLPDLIESPKASKVKTRPKPRRLFQNEPLPEQHSSKTVVFSREYVPQENVPIIESQKSSCAKVSPISSKVRGRPQPKRLFHTESTRPKINISPRFVPRVFNKPPPSPPKSPIPSPCLTSPTCNPPVPFPHSPTTWQYETPPKCGIKAAAESYDPVFERLADEYMAADQLFTESPEFVEDLPDSPLESPREGYWKSPSKLFTNLEEQRNMIDNLFEESAPEWAPQDCDIQVVSPQDLSNEDIWAMHKRVEQHEKQQIQRRGDVTMLVGKRRIAITKAGKANPPSLVSLREEYYVEELPKNKEEWKRARDKQYALLEAEIEKKVNGSPSLSPQDSDIYQLPEQQWTYQTPPQLKTCVPERKTQSRSPKNSSPKSSDRVKRKISPTTCPKTCSGRVSRSNSSHKTSRTTDGSYERPDYFTNQPDSVDLDDCSPPPNLYSPQNNESRRHKQKKLPDMFTAEFQDEYEGIFAESPPDFESLNYILEEEPSDVSETITPSSYRRDIFKDAHGVDYEDIFGDQSPQFVDTPSTSDFYIQGDPSDSQRRYIVVEENGRNPRIVRTPKQFHPSVLVARTPISANRTLEEDFRFPEMIRFEPLRQMQSIQNYYSTPRTSTIRNSPRQPGKCRSKTCKNRTCKRRLISQIEEVEKQDDEDMNERFNILSSVRSIPTSEQSSYIESSTPPRMTLSPSEVDEFGEINYEPADFNFFRSPGNSSYEARLPFEGQEGPGLFSPCHIDRISEEDANFRWMDRLQRRWQ